jgi:hypothetical protein
LSGERRRDPAALDSGTCSVEETKGMLELADTAFVARFRLALDATTMGVSKRLSEKAC